MKTFPSLAALACAAALLSLAPTALAQSDTPAAAPAAKTEAAPAPAPEAAPATDAAAPPAADAAAPAPAAEPIAAAPPETPAASTEPEAAAPAAPAEAGLIPPPPEGKGQIVFYRPSKFTGAALSFSVRENGVGVAKVPNGTYSVAVVEPGVHEYAMQGEVKDVLRLEVEPGETYYLRHEITMGMMMGRPILVPSDKAAFEAKKLKLSTATPTSKEADKKD